MPTGRPRWQRTSVRELSPFQAPESTNSVDAGGRQGRDFAPEAEGRQGGNLNVFQAAADHLKALQARGKRVLVASWTEGSAERMGGVLSDHGVSPIRKVADWPEALKLDKAAFGIACLGIERGFEAPDFAMLSRTGCAGRPHGARADPRAPGAEFPRRGFVAGAGRSGHPYRAWRGPLSLG